MTRLEGRAAGTARAEATSDDASAVTAFLRGLGPLPGPTPDLPGLVAAEAVTLILAGELAHDALPAALTGEERALVAAHLDALRDFATDVEGPDAPGPGFGPRDS